jgi:hypothetical protein
MIRSSHKPRLNRLPHDNQRGGEVAPRSPLCQPGRLRGAWIRHWSLFHSNATPHPVILVLMGVCRCPLSDCHQLHPIRHMWRHYRGCRINDAHRPTALPGAVVSPQWHMPSCVVRGCAFVSAHPLSPRNPPGHPCRRGPWWGDPLWVASVSDYMDHVGTAHSDLPADDLAAAPLFRCPTGCGFVSSAEYLYWHVTGVCLLLRRWSRACTSSCPRR